MVHSHEGHFFHAAHKCPPFSVPVSLCLCAVSKHTYVVMLIYSIRQRFRNTSWPSWRRHSCTHTRQKKSALSWANAVPVVLPRIHLGVFHSVLLGEEHEGVHWPFAFCRRGTACCPWGVPPVWFTCWGLWRAGALKFVTVWTYGTPTRQGGSALAGHAAQNVHGWGI